MRNTFSGLLEAMELTFLGVPCIIAGDPVYRAIPLNYSRDKSHYFQMIDGASELKVTQVQQNNVVKYLYLLKEQNIFVNCIYELISSFVIKK